MNPATATLSLNSQLRVLNDLTRRTSTSPYIPTNHTTPLPPVGPGKGPAALMLGHRNSIVALTPGSGGANMAAVLRLRRGHTAGAGGMESEGGPGEGGVAGLEQWSRLLSPTSSSMTPAASCNYMPEIREGEGGEEEGGSHPDGLLHPGGCATHTSVAHHSPAPQTP